MQIIKNGFSVIGICPFKFGTNENLEDFNKMNQELKNQYGMKNVWFDREIKDNKIIFLTH